MHRVVFETKWGWYSNCVFIITTYILIKQYMYLKILLDIIQLHLVSPDQAPPDYLYHSHLSRFITVPSKVPAMNNHNLSYWFEITCSMIVDAPSVLGETIRLSE